MVASHAADLKSDWQFDQKFEPDRAGLLKVIVPPETLDKCQPGFEDLRVTDSAGNEVPYWIERPTPTRQATQPAKSFHVSLDSDTTAITLETGVDQPVDGIALETPAPAFIKSVKVEGSADGAKWQTLGTGQPIFRQSGGVEALNIPFEPGVWKWLRLTVDDHRSPPIPFTAARLRSALSEISPSEPLGARITGRNEAPGETRLTLDLGWANMDLASLDLETSESLFVRQVSVAELQVSQDAAREITIGQGTIYRVAVDGRPVSANTHLPMDSRAHSREIVILIRNQNSPPLPITEVRVQRHPVHLVFNVREIGSHHWVSGNPRVSGPNYDLAALGINLKTVALAPVKVGPLETNLGYRAHQPLSGMPEAGAALDVAAWNFRKAVQVPAGGPQQLDLDLEVLSRAQPGGEDLRLVRAGNQLPYLLERTSLSRSIAPKVVATNDTKNAKLSQWLINLPHPNLPVNRVVCESPSPIFNREMTLYEQVPDERGETYRRPLGHGIWIQTPNQKIREFVLDLDSPPGGNQMVLETDNGDNPAVSLQNFRCYYPLTRMIFKAAQEAGLFLYYGNPGAVAPHYDLALVANELISAKRRDSVLGPEQRLKNGPSSNKLAGKNGVIFWLVLAVVVVVLLVLVARLLPRAGDPPKSP